MMMFEMGKMLVVVKVEVLKCVKGFCYYVENVEVLLVDEFVDVVKVGVLVVYG